jgi:hypothetical protein
MPKPTPADAPAVDAGVFAQAVNVVEHVARAIRRVDPARWRRHRLEVEPSLFSPPLLLNNTLSSPCMSF